MPQSKNRIAKIAIKGFKSIGSEQSIDIRPLTILAGANSSGKSSFMQPLLLLKQTLESPGDPGALLLDGPNVRFTKGEQVLSANLNKKTRTRVFSIKITLLEGATFELVFCYKKSKGFDLEKMSFRKDVIKAQITKKMSIDDILKILPPYLLELVNKVIKIKGDIQWQVERKRCFFDLSLLINHKKINDIFYNLPSISNSNILIPLIEDVIHLPGLRGNPSRTYPRTAGGPFFPGTFEEYVASVIAEWQSNGGKSKLKQLAKDLETMGLTWKVRAESIDDTQVELMVGRLGHSSKGGAQDLVSIADVGFGVSQALPVLVALLAARPGQLVYLEQPEIHLHPLAQRKLAGIFCEAVKRGVVAVIETHSSILLREIQTLIAKNKLNKEDVAMHWLQRNKYGETCVQTAMVDDDGAYGDWPADFDNIELDAEQSYLDAVEAKHSGLR
ncbi:MAG: AAA family ATPase [Deltaproteobacteria bacterium]|nr:AAA family ATPase [Deltaproteobacteria bacterium]